MGDHVRFDDIPPDREDGGSSWVHTALIVTGKLGRLPAWWLTPLWIALALLSARPWQGQRGTLTAIAAGFILADWILLAALPWTRRSWGPVTPSLLGLSIVHTVLFVLGGLLASASLLPWRGVLLWGTLILNATVTGVAWYATWIEPFAIRLTRETLSVAAWPSDTPLTLLHLSDIHFERRSLREDRLLALVERLQPDLIVLTGDYLNLSSVYDPEAQAGARRLLAPLSAPYGVYAITGSPVVDREGIVPEIFAGLPIRWLEDEVVEVQVEAGTLSLLGIRNTYHEERDIQALKEATAKAAGPRVLLYHTPDLAPVAAEAGIDLYLCGHTHGGQIRAPVYGAIATSSRYGKRYEQGRVAEGEMTLYISRGLGLEGLGAPRARFLAPPEVILWEVRQE